MPQLKIDWCDVRMMTSSLIGCVVGETIVFGRQAVILESPDAGGTRCTVLFADEIEHIILLTEAEAVAYLTARARKRGEPDPIGTTNAEFCHEDTCIEPATASGFCAAHQPKEN